MGEVGSLKLNAVELFAGGGGLALGTHRAGFRHLALLESNENAVETLKINSRREVGVKPELALEPIDVRKFDYDRIDAPTNLLAAGAPCQPFSLGGLHKGEEDSRNLFPEVFRAQRELHPDALLLENVRGLTRPSFRAYLEYILLQLALPGLEREQDEAWQQHKERLVEALSRGEVGSHPAYDVRLAAIECANFGVPQKRNRVFIVGFRTDLGAEWAWPEETHSSEALEVAKYDTGEYWKQHSMSENDLPHEERLRLNGDGATPPSNGTARWRTVRDVTGSLPDPPEREAHGIHPNHIGIPGAKKYPGHTGSPLDEPAKTLKAGVHGVPGGENMLRRPDGSVRYFTVFESSLLQTFPSEYVFHGSRTAAMRQIGNAAPVRVCEILAKRIRDELEMNRTESTTGSPKVDLLDSTQLTLV